ncbi:MAG: hypothetical protein O2970_00160 [Proteobacteria bacterium]|nr:hypothetical protein [Pseudomonadota bacterium]MDA0965354.1 hypothetical protein [Pseudomonadota bacterium]MDG4544282.1 hypothetical protein [Rickettsiales bacterium]MDG4546995.1 hypothetical protein [Rickettsiales bacterium]
MTNQHSIEVRQLSILGVAERDVFIARNLTTVAIATEISGYYY